MNYTLYYYTAALLMLLSAGVTFLIGLKQKSPLLKLLVVYMFFSFFADVVAWAIYLFFNTSSDYIGAAFRLVEFLLLLEFYGRILELKKFSIVRKIVLVLGALIYIFVFDLDPNPTRTTNTVLFSILSTIYFIKLIIEMKISNPMTYPLFWINAALLGYFSGNVFFALFFATLGKLHEVSAVLSFGFHNTLGLAKNILIAIAFWISYKNPNWEKSLVSQS